MLKGEVAPRVDYKVAAVALAKCAALATGRSFNEAEVQVIQSLTDREAQNYFEALSRATEAAAGNPKK